MSEDLVNITNSKTKEPLYIKTYGCQMNVYDSDKLEKILEKSHSIVDTPEKANLILINTCSVRDKPEQKLYSLLGKLQKLKKTNTDLRIGVGGCVAQQEGENIAKRSKAVDFVFGTHNLSLVPSLLKRVNEGLGQQVAVNYRDEWEDLPLGLSDKSRVSAFVSISRGCNKNCAYCIVPVTRGKEVSRDPKEIEREVKIAARRGAKEIILLGQTVNSYGLDFNPRMKFSELLDKISQVEEIKRIRFISPHPQEIRKDFFELVRDNEKICNHVHMPLQSGSSKILKAMNRNYKRERYLKIIEGLREHSPNISITTDIIVGFPGESQQDFEDTLSVMKEVKFDNCYSYMFSPRPGTIAENMEGQVPKEIMLERLQTLQTLQDEISIERLKSFVGKTAEVLIDGPSTFDSTKLQGRLSENIRLNFTKHYEDLSPGDIVNVAISGTSKYTLKGEVIR